MRTPRITLLVTLLIALLCACTEPAAEGTGADGTPNSAILSVGDPAPDFDLLGSDGRSWRLRDLVGEAGRDGVVLAWFPKAFTPG